MNNHVPADVMSIDSDDTSSSVNTEENNLNPLMKLFKRLIGNDSKQNTVLTNAQIIDILHKEFDMDISYTHDLAIEIYLNLMKKFLKDWPQWDTFDQAIQTLKLQKDSASIEKMLEMNYKDLKVYLNKMLEAATPRIMAVVNETKELSRKDVPNSSDDDVVLEISCSRAELNKLFFRRPHPDFNNSIFNVPGPSNKITIRSNTLKSMLYWPNLEFTFNVGSIIIQRITDHVIQKHTLVNKKINVQESTPTELKTNFQVKDSRQTSPYTLKDLFKFIETNMLSAALPTSEKSLFNMFMTVLRNDLIAAPQTTHIPCLFRKAVNKYPFVRYLYSEVTTKKAFNYTGNSCNLYDLQLEEIAYPQIYICILKFDPNTTPRMRTKDGQMHWLLVQCTNCNERFTNVSLEMMLKQHLEQCHPDEPNWECHKCKKTLHTIGLAEDGWRHTCEET